jgi:hypothetical protein
MNGRRVWASPQGANAGGIFWRWPAGTKVSSGAAPTGSAEARQIQRLTDWLLRYWLVSVYQTISTSIATRGPAAR